MVQSISLSSFPSSSCFRSRRLFDDFFEWQLLEDLVSSKLSPDSSIFTSLIDFLCNLHTYCSDNDWFCAFLIAWPPPWYLGRDFLSLASSDSYGDLVGRVDISSPLFGRTNRSAFICCSRVRSRRQLSFIFSMWRFNNCATNLVRLLLTTVHCKGIQKTAWFNKFVHVTYQKRVQTTFWTTSIRFSSPRWKTCDFIPSFADLYPTCITSTTVSSTVFVFYCITMTSVAFFVSSANIASMSHRVKNTSMRTSFWSDSSTSSSYSLLSSLLSVLP